MVWDTCQLNRVLLSHPGRLDKFSIWTVVGVQPVEGFNVKSAITSGLTQIVCVSDVIPQALIPDVNNVIEYVPAVLNVMFKVLVAVWVQTEGLFGNVPLKPKLPTTVTKGFGFIIPLAPTVNAPEGPIICQYRL